MFDLNIPKLLILAVIALIVFGPKELPKIASQAGQALRDLRRIAEGAKNDLREGLGPEFADFEIEIHDGGTMHANEPRRAEACFQFAHRFAQDMSVSAAMQANIIVGGFNPVDICQLQENNAAPSAAPSIRKPAIRRGLFS